MKRANKITSDAYNNKSKPSNGPGRPTGNVKKINSKRWHGDSKKYGILES